MPKHAKRSPRASTRRKMTKGIREKGAPSITIMMQKFNPGDKVHIHTNPSVHQGMPFRRFNGLTGQILGNQGTCYYVRISDKNAQKEILIHPAHLLLQK